MTKDREPTLFDDERPSPLCHPSYMGTDDEDKWGLVDQMEIDEIITTDEAIAERHRLHEAESPEQRRSRFRVILGEKGTSWSRYTDRPDLRPVRNIFRVIKGER